MVCKPLPTPEIFPDIISNQNLVKELIGTMKSAVSNFVISSRQHASAIGTAVIEDR